jgi:hypothetical protein
MRVLITNASLDALGGTQAYVRDLAFWLLAQGHSPVVYSLRLGETARQLERRTVPVTRDLATVSVAPDIIHGNSATETMIALLQFPATPAIFVCHGWTGPAADPPRFPRILRYVAVDETCADRLVMRCGIPAQSVVVLLNAVDPERFVKRGDLPERPGRALVFSNTAHALTHRDAVADACRRAGIALDVVGLYSGNSVEEPEAILGRYDLVFAKAKCALEAMACGAAVILCDARGLGGMVRAADVPRLRRLNFGARCLDEPLSVESISRAIAAYDPVDAAAVSEEIRRTAASDGLHGEILALYGAVIEEYKSASFRAAWQNGESLAAAQFLRGMAEGADPDAQMSRLTPIIQAMHRLLSAPVIGPSLTRGARWLLHRRRPSG